MGALSRRKGATYERAVATRLREAFPGLDVRRGWQSDGREAPDVQAGPFSCECKHKGSISAPAALKDAEEHAPAGTIPVVWLRWHRGVELVCMKPEDWLRIAGQWWRDNARDQESQTVEAPRTEARDDSEPDVAR